MKNTFKYLSLVLFATLCASCDKDDSPDDNNIKRYNVESGIINYTTNTTGTAFGATITGTGTAQLYFKKWGAIELSNEERTESSVSTNPLTGQTITETNTYHETSKIDNELIYTVNYDNKKILTQKKPLIEFMRLNNYDALEAGKKMLESLGGTQLDNQEFKGYDCEVWTGLGSKQWIYKGITLKIVTTIAGITIIKEAVDIKFDVSVSDSYFKLPDFQIIPING